MVDKERGDESQNKFHSFFFEIKTTKIKLALRTVDFNHDVILNEVIQSRKKQQK